MHISSALPSMILAIAIATLTFHPLASAGDTAAAQIESVMAKRHAAQKLGGVGATTANIRIAAEQLEKLLVHLQDEDVRDLANGSQYLHAEKLNILIPLSEMYARLGMNDKALTALEKSLDVYAIPQLVDGYVKKEDYKSLRSDPRFQAILKRTALPKRLWEVPAIATAYKPVLSMEEKVAGLSLFWHEARQHFAHFDHVPDLQWDAVYMEYLPKVMAASTTAEYYRIMARVAALLEDGHTNVYPPEQLNQLMYSRPPMVTMMVEGRVLVTEIHSPTLERQLRVGEEIVAIDGVPVLEYAQKQIAPFVSSSTPQDRQVRTYRYQLLLGDEAKPVTLRLRAADGTERDERVARGGYTDKRSSKRFNFKMLEGGVAYLSLDQFESDEGIKAFERELPRIMAAKGLVLDVRGNGGGSSTNGYKILSYLAKGAIPGSASYVREDDILSRVRNGSTLRWQQVADGAKVFSAKREQSFAGPVAVLMGPRSFSAAEDFLVAFDLMKRGVMVGEASGGSTGQPYFFALPGGGSARICIKRDVYPDGRIFVGKGVSPHIVSAPTIASVRNGSDPVLQAALAAIARGQGNPAVKN